MRVTTHTHKNLVESTPGPTKHRVPVGFHGTQCKGRGDRAKPCTAALKSEAQREEWAHWNRRGPSNQGWSGNRTTKRMSCAPLAASNRSLTRLYNIAACCTIVAPEAPQQPEHGKPAGPQREPRRMGCAPQLPRSHGQGRTCTWQTPQQHRATTASCHIRCGHHIPPTHRSTQGHNGHAPRGEDNEGHGSENTVGARSSGHTTTSGSALWSGCIYPLPHCWQCQFSV